MGRFYKPTTPAVSPVDFAYELPYDDLVQAIEKEDTRITEYLTDIRSRDDNFKDYKAIGDAETEAQQNYFKRARSAFDEAYQNVQADVSNWRQHVSSFKKLGDDVAKELTEGSIAKMHENAMKLEAFNRSVDADIASGKYNTRDGEALKKRRKDDFLKAGGTQFDDGKYNKFDDTKISNSINLSDYFKKAVDKMKSDTKFLASKNITTSGAGRNIFVDSRTGEELNSDQIKDMLRSYVEGNSTLKSHRDDRINLGIYTPEEYNNEINSAADAAATYYNFYKQQGNVQHKTNQEHIQAQLSRQRLYKLKTETRAKAKAAAAQRKQQQASVTQTKSLVGEDPDYNIANLGSGIQTTVIRTEDIGASTHQELVEDLENSKASTEKLNMEYLDKITKDLKKNFKLNGEDINNIKEVIDSGGDLDTYLSQNYGYTNPYSKDKQIFEKNRTRQDAITNNEKNKKEAWEETARYQVPTVYKKKAEEALTSGNIKQGIDLSNQMSYNDIVISSMLKASEELEVVGAKNFDEKRQYAEQGLKNLSSAVSWYRNNQQTKLEKSRDLVGGSIQLAVQNTLEGIKKDFVSNDADGKYSAQQIEATTSQYKDLKREEESIKKQMVDKLTNYIKTAKDDNGELLFFNKNNDIYSPKSTLYYEDLHFEKIFNRKDDEGNPLIEGYQELYKQLEENRQKQRMLNVEYEAEYVIPSTENKEMLDAQTGIRVDNMLAEGQGVFQKKEIWSDNIDLIEGLPFNNPDNKKYILKKKEEFENKLLTDYNNIPHNANLKVVVKDGGIEKDLKIESPNGMVQEQQRLTDEAKKNTSLSEYETDEDNNVISKTKGNVPFLPQSVTYDNDPENPRVKITYINEIDQSQTMEVTFDQNKISNSTMKQVYDLTKVEGVINKTITEQARMSGTSSDVRNNIVYHPAAINPNLKGVTYDGSNYYLNDTRFDGDTYYLHVFKNVANPKNEILKSINQNEYAKILAKRNSNRLRVTRQVVKGGLPTVRAPREKSYIGIRGGKIGLFTQTQLEKAVPDKSKIPTALDQLEAIEFIDPKIKYVSVSGNAEVDINAYFLAWVSDKNFEKMDDALNGFKTHLNEEEDKGVIKQVKK